MDSLITSRPSSWLYEDRRLREVGGLAGGPLRLAKPTFEGEEPERERGGVCTDIMVEWKYTAAIELMEEDTHCQKSYICKQPDMMHIIDV